MMYMKRLKNVYLMLMSVILLMGAVSCNEEKKESYPPIWKGFRVETRTPKAGAPYEVTAVQSRKGKYLNATYYVWTLTFETATDGMPDYDENGNVKKTVLTKEYKTNYDGLDNSDPKHTFEIPGNAVGRATVEFEARYNYSAAGVPGEFGPDNDGTADDCVGSIRSTSGAISGGSHGTLSITIQAKE